MKYILSHRNFYIMILIDFFLVAACFYSAYLCRFEFVIPEMALRHLLFALPFIIIFKICTFFFFNLYHGMWRYASLVDLVNVLKAVFTSSLVIVFGILMLHRFHGFPRSVFIIDAFLTFFAVGGIRIVIRFYFAWRSGMGVPPIVWRSSHEGKRRLLIIGAGDAGEKVLREMHDNPGLNFVPIGFLDDDPNKQSRTIHGVPVLGPLHKMNEIVKISKVDETIIAISSASFTEMRRIVNLCETAGLPFKTLPGLGELIEGKVSISSIREVRYEDLLGRKQVELNMDQIGGYLKDKRVLVTGGAGSIGSELCRQIAPFNPAHIIIIDKNESGLYEMGLDLSSRFPELKMHTALGLVQNMIFLQRVFNQYKPEVVFHAAAYKHVPMMEINPWEAVFNNIVGTKTILSLCSSNSVDRFVLVSTDKAVRPANVMGASKRVDEILAQIYGRENKCKFMAVRFGNVVGSAGSVIPLFKKQIEKGGPVTVTHPEITRYFMTIPEASRLILQAGALGKGGEIFILKMGIPICIADMARDMIALSGLRPDDDIKIKYIGLRPGEKLFEELTNEFEEIKETEHKDIMVLGVDSDIPIEDINEHIRRLVKSAKVEDAMGVKKELKRIVPEYLPLG